MCHYITNKFLLLMYLVKYLGFNLDKRLIWNNPIRAKILIITATKVLLYFNKLLTTF